MDINKLVKLGLDENKAREVYEQVEKYILSKIREKTKEFEEKNLELQLNLVVERQLFMAGARNIKATKALLNFDGVNKKDIDEDYIKAMIDELKQNEETRFLFFEQNAIKLKGFKPLETNVNNNMLNRDLSYEELCKHYEKGIF